MIAWVVITSLVQLQNDGQHKPISIDNKFLINLLIASVIRNLFVSKLYPVRIAHIIDKFIPLPDGELKRNIEVFAASVDLPSYKVYIVEGSKRSAHSNAYIHGFFKHKKIVLYDTLIKGFCKSEDVDGKEDKGCKNDEIIGILAHEFGHWKYSHPIKIFLLQEVIFFSVLNAPRIINEFERYFMWWKNNF